MLPMKRSNPLTSINMNSTTNFRTSGAAIFHGKRFDIYQCGQPVTVSALAFIQVCSRSGTVFWPLTPLGLIRIRAEEIRHAKVTWARRVHTHRYVSLGEADSLTDNAYDKSLQHKASSFSHLSPLSGSPYYAAIPLEVSYKLPTRVTAPTTRILTYRD